MLIYSQGEMAQNIDGLDKEIETLIVNRIGQDRVRVWQYFTGWD